MKCKHCGHDNSKPWWVYKAMTGKRLSPEGSTPANLKMYVYMECERCGQLTERPE